jgi:hypothetical protein
VRNTPGIFLAILVALAALAGGCRTISKGVSESVMQREKAEHWHVHYGSRIHYMLTNTTMKEVEFEGALTASDTTVRYQRGLADQARCIADTTADLLRRVHEETGVTITTRSTIYLFRFDQRPQNFDVDLEVEPNEFPLPLFVRAGQESCESILVQNRSYPYLFVHEMVETSLAAGRVEGVVLPDFTWGFLGLEIHINNHTRWFRDGLANYAGYIAHEALSEDIPNSQRLQYRQTLLHTNPFSSLAQIGDKLFSWVQSSRTDHERVYYNAALGLFLLIEDLYGQEAIHRIMTEIAQRQTVDGRDLLEITRGVLRTDIRQLARDFEFPQFGVEMERLTPALALNHGMEVHEGLFVQSVSKDSVAMRVGLQEKDIITAVGDAPVANYLDFELAVFKARNESFISLTVERQGAATRTIELPLHEPATSRTQAKPAEAS